MKIIPVAEAHRFLTPCSGRARDTRGYCWARSCHIQPGGNKKREEGLQSWLTSHTALTVILSCTPPPGAILTRSVTEQSQLSRRRHAFELPQPIQEGANKKPQPGSPDYSRALQIAPDIFIQAAEADPCALQQTNQSTNSPSIGPSEYLWRASEPWPHEPNVPFRTALKAERAPD